LETLAQLPRESVGNPIPGGVPAQVEWGSLTQWAATSPQQRVWNSALSEAQLQ